MSDEEIKAVVAFERVVFGGKETEEVLLDCGLIEPDEDESMEEAASSMP